jgi:hypothetical protein
MALLALDQTTDDARQSANAIRDFGKQFSGGGRTKPVQGVSPSLDTEAVILVHRVGSSMMPTGWKYLRRDAMFPIPLSRTPSPPPVSASRDRRFRYAATPSNARRLSPSTIVRPATSISFNSPRLARS